MKYEYTRPEKPLKPKKKNFFQKWWYAFNSNKTIEELEQEGKW